MIRRPPRSTLFPYTTSSDLRDSVPRARRAGAGKGADRVRRRALDSGHLHDRGPRLEPRGRDRKSTRLNSSHTVISYAVFCLKKKKKCFIDTPTIATAIAYAR